MSDETPKGTYSFIQWKGSGVCLDFHCECGWFGHVDADYCYTIRCGGCGVIWESPSHLTYTVSTRPANEDSNAIDPEPF